MRFPEHRAKVFTPEARRKSALGRSAFLRSGSPEAIAQVERIRLLNPTKDPATRAKLSRRLREIGHRPPVRGGNGRGPTEPQRLLHAALGPGPRRQPGFPTNYKLDLAHPGLRIGIEVDGASHNTMAGRQRDAKKADKLASLGWTVLRFSNRDILTWIATGTPTESSICTTLLSHGIRPSA